MCLNDIKDVLPANYLPVYFLVFPDTFRYQFSSPFSVWTLSRMFQWLYLSPHLLLHKLLSETIKRCKVACIFLNSERIFYRLYFFIKYFLISSFLLRNHATYSLVFVSQRFFVFSFPLVPRRQRRCRILIRENYITNFLFFYSSHFFQAYAFPVLSFCDFVLFLLLFPHVLFPFFFELFLLLDELYLDCNLTAIVRTILSGPSFHRILFLCLQND